MDTEQDDSIYVTHYQDRVELRLIFTNEQGLSVLTQEEARTLAGLLLQAASIAETWKERM